MRKRLISICTTFILVFSIYGCAQTAEDTPVAEIVSAVLHDTEAERGEVELKDTVAESDEASAEGELDKTVAGGGQEQGEAETDPMSNIKAQDMFTYKIQDNSVVITGLQAKYENYLKEKMSAYGEIEIPDTMFEYPVVEIGDHAFEDIKLKSVHIPESVEIIGNSAFRNTRIEDVNLSECYNLKEVKANAFENCNLQDDDFCTWFMEKIGERAFAGNEKLTQVNFWSGDVIIEKDAFDGCGDELLFYVVWSREETGKEVEAYAAANGIKMEYSVATQINVPSEPLLLTPEIGSFFMENWVVHTTIGTMICFAVLRKRRMLPILVLRTGSGTAAVNGNISFSLLIRQLLRRNLILLQTVTVPAMPSVKIENLHG